MKCHPECRYPRLPKTTIDERYRLGSNERNFRRADAVSAIEVIEHAYDPLKLLACLASAVRVGGIIIVATGNTRAPTWRMMGSRYGALPYFRAPVFQQSILGRDCSTPTRVGNCTPELILSGHADGGASPKQRVYEASPIWFSGLHRSCWHCCGGSALAALTSVANPVWHLRHLTG